MIELDVFNDEDYGHNAVRQRVWLIAVHCSRSGIDVAAARQLICDTLAFVDKLKITPETRESFF